MAATVLLIESARGSMPSFGPPLDKRGYTVVPANSGKAAIQTAKDKPPDIIVLDAASMRTSGNRICRQLREQFEDIPIIHIKVSPGNGKEPAATVTLYHPFTPRKLINRIERFLNADQGEMLVQGPFKLNLQQRLLFARGKKHRLTPKMAHLVETFMRNPGKTLDREYLMQQVWHTQFMGDTRTLDVHIRWIRQVIEGEPGSPRYLITVRGVGYCFEPDSAEQRASNQKLPGA